MKAIQVKEISQHFGQTQIFTGLNLEVERGVFGLLGPNGAGKTTLLRMLATILPPARGTLRLLGYDPRDKSERRALRRQLGYLPQTFGYYPTFTLWEFVEYIALLKEVPSHMLKQQVATAIERVGLEGRAHSKLKTLSGGMLRRAGDSESSSIAVAGRANGGVGSAATS
jgi:ABC-type multidrug transport system ATPase subunit